MTRRVPKERQSNDKAAPHSRLIVARRTTSGSRVLHQKIALCAGVLALSLAVSASVSAQQAPAPPYYPGGAHPVYPGRLPAMPPHEILASVRSIGLEPLSGPVRFGPLYSLRAVDPAGREVRVIADARTGRILKVHPVLFPRYAAPVPPPPSYGPYGLHPGRITAVPDGYGPNSRIATLPPGAAGPPPHVPAAGGLPAVRAPAAVPPPVAQAGSPPLPRPRPKLAADATAVPPVTSAASQAQPQPAPQAKGSETTGTIAPSVAPPSARVEEHE
jgi:hypothetical protein